jgi:hypothetical protein
VLNSTLGKIGRGRTFFFKAFGRNESEFAELIRMPEAFIIKRWDAEMGGFTDKWRKAYAALSDIERGFVDGIVETHVFDASKWQDQSSAVRKVMAFYLLEREHIPSVEKGAKTRRIVEFERSCPIEVSAECQRLLNECR